MIRCPAICFLKAVLLAVGYCVFAQGHIQAQTLGPDFLGAYNVRDIGVPNVAAFNGCILFKTNDPSVLLVGGNEGGQSEGIYQLKVQRDAQGHISGFSGAATLVAYAPGNPAAPFDVYGLYSTMDYGPEGVLFYPTFDSAIGQIKAGSSSPSRFIVTSELEMDYRAGGLVFVPAGFPGAGRLKIGGSQWLDTTVKADGSGTFDILKPARTIGVSYPSSMAYVFAGHSGFSKNSVLVVHQFDEAVTAYEIDDNGDPIVESARPFLTSFWQVSCIQRDPATGDYLVSSSDINQSRIMVVGSQAQAAIEVNLITPADGTRLRAPGSFMMEAQASEAGGSIAKLELFQDATLIASAQSTSSYLALIDSLPAGEYNFTAVAYDASGRSATSKVARVSVFNEGPIVTLLSPTNNTPLRSCSSVFLKAKIQAGNSAISRVEFRDGNLVLGSFNVVDNVYPVSFQVHHLDEGAHFYTVVAIDANGMAGADAATNVVAAPLPMHSLTIQHYDSTLLQCFRGMPGINYVWERSDSLTSANWQPFLTNQSANGRVHLTNSFVPAPPARYFRTRQAE